MFIAVCQSNIQQWAAGTTKTFICSSPLEGQYVTVQFDSTSGTNRWLNICELEVYAADESDTTIITSVSTITSSDASSSSPDAITSSSEATTSSLDAIISSSDATTSSLDAIISSSDATTSSSDVTTNSSDATVTSTYATIPKCKWDNYWYNLKHTHKIHKSILRAILFEIMRRAKWKKKRGGSAKN